MIIKDILKETTAIICGRIDPKENNVEKMLGIMEYNRSALEACHSIVLVLNRGGDVSEREMTEISKAYKDNFKLSFLVQPHPVGMGYQIGHVLLDKTGYLFAKNNLHTKYTMKICNDILLSDKFLDQNIKPADLYYLPSVAIDEVMARKENARNQHDQTIDYTSGPLFYQSWFFIASNCTDVLYESDEEIERVFLGWNRNDDPRQSRVLCAEHSLARWSANNKIKRHSLYTPEQFDNYCQFVVRNQLYDGSMKNVTIESIGITHLHFAEKPLLQCNY